jgi:hypothetical protein
MADTPPTQSLKPRCVIDGYDEAVTEIVNKELDDMVRRGTILKQRTVSELRHMVRKRLARKYKIEGGPPPRQLLDSIIERRLA